MSAPSHSVASLSTAADTGREGTPRALPADQSRSAPPVAERALPDDDTPPVASEDWPGGVEQSAPRHFPATDKGRAYAETLRRLHATGMTQRAIAHEIGVTRSRISQLAKALGLTFQHGSSVAIGMTLPDRLTPAEMREYRNLRNQNCRMDESLRAIGRGDILEGFAR